MRDTSVVVDKAEKNSFHDCTSGFHSYVVVTFPTGCARLITSCVASSYNISLPEECENALHGRDFCFIFTF